MTIDRITYLYVMPPIQQPSLFLYINRLYQLPYDLMLLDTNLTHYYTALDTATLMIWCSRYNNQPTTPLYRTDTTTYMLWQLIESPIYMLCHRYSNLAYSYTTIDSASFPMILWYYWKIYYIIILQCIQQPWWYDTFATTTNYTTIHDLIQKSLCYDTDTTA